MGRVSSKQNTREHVFGAKQLDYHGLFSFSLPGFPKLTSKPPISRFFWRFLFISLETGIIGLRQTPSGPRVEWIQYEFCVCVFFCLTCGFWKFWICFEHFQNWQISCIHPLFQFLLQNRKDLAMPHPRFHVAGAEWWLLSIEGACALWFSSVSTTPCVTSLVLETLDTPPRPKEEPALWNSVQTT